MKLQRSMLWNQIAADTDHLTLKNRTELMTTATRFIELPAHAALARQCKTELLRFSSPRASNMLHIQS